jgi:hypothetical protein
MNLAAIESMSARFPQAQLCFIESSRHKQDRPGALGRSKSGRDGNGCAAHARYESGLVNHTREKGLRAIEIRVFVRLT